MQKFLKISCPLIFLLLKFSTLNSQTDVSFQMIDSLTYNLYKNESWEPLKQYSEKAINNNIDYYYLRMRTGIAYYMTGEYLKAVPHFKKAIQFNSFSKDAYEYIYYAMNFSGRIKEAQVFAKKNKIHFPDSLINKRASLRNISLDFAYHTNNENNLSSRFEDFNASGTLEGYQIIPRSFIHTDFLFTHDLSARTSFSHGGTFLRKNSYYYSSAQGNSYVSDNHKINQMQYYAGLRIHTGINSWFYSSIHFLKYNSPDMSFFPRSTGYRFIYPEQNYNYYSARIAFFKNLYLLESGVGLNYSKLSFDNQYQADLFLSYKPQGNLNLYFNSYVYAVIDDTKVGLKKRFSFSHKVGFKIFEILWTEINAFYGDIRTLSTNNGFVIYNGEETINQRYDLNIIFPLRTLNLYLNGSFLNYSSRFIEDQSLDVYNNLDFNGITIIGGISWNI